MIDQNDEADLIRYEDVCAILYNEAARPSDEFIISALVDNYVSVRSEALDYVIEIDGLNEHISSAINERYKNEDSEQCIGRLMLIAAKLGHDPFFESMPTGISRFEIDYLAVWSSIALSIQDGGASTPIVALSYTIHPDITIAQLAKNLLLEYCFDDDQLDHKRQTLLGLR